MKLSRNARKLWGYALTSALVLTAAAWPSVQKSTAAGEKFYWCGKEQKNITVLETEADTPNEITFTEGSAENNLGYAYIDSVTKEWSVTDVTVTINGTYQFAIADSISSKAGKADGASADAANDRQKLDLPHVWGGYDASKFPITATNDSTATLSAIANSKFVLNVNSTATDITSISVSFKSTWLSQGAPVPTKSPQELAGTFFYCDNEMEDINVLETVAATPNKIRLTTENTQNMGWAYIGSATKEWSISNVVLKVNDKYWFDLDGATSKPAKMNNTSTENDCQKIELPNIWNKYISTKLAEKYKTENATFEKVTTGEGDSASTSFVLTANGKPVDISKFAITFETTALSQPSFVDDAPTPAPGGDATPTPAPGGNTTPTPTPGGDATPTPTPGGDATPTPTPGGDATPTPTPGGNATPTPGGNATPAPGTSATPTPAPGGNNTPTTVGLAKNAKATVGNFSYKVTKTSVKNAGKTTNGNVTVVAMSKKGKKAKKLSVPATIKAKGATYTVTAIGANAMKGSKATSVTLGKNVKSIAKNAFANCKKLSKLSIKAKLSSVSKGAFKGCKKKIKVSGTSKKQNLKKLKKSGYKKFK